LIRKEEKLEMKEEKLEMKEETRIGYKTYMTEKAYIMR
jgi:hypothetical protein